MGRRPCCDKVGLKKGPWSAEEDQKLINFILNHGQCCWRLVPKLAGLLRCGKSCRLRWINYLRPDLKRGILSESEEKLIIDLHAQLGNRWSKIASHLPGRTDNEIKNLWHTQIKKKLVNSGLNPSTHEPISSSSEFFSIEDKNVEKSSSILCSSSEKKTSLEENRSSSVSVSVSSDSECSFGPLIKSEEKIEIPEMDWIDPMWLMEFEDFAGLEFLSENFDAKFSSFGSETF